MNKLGWLNPITIDLLEINDEIIEWLVDAGGEHNPVYESNSLGGMQLKNYIRYGSAKWCHISSSGQARLHFCAEDDNIALMFLLKFDRYIARHNMKELLNEESLLY